MKTLSALLISIFTSAASGSVLEGARVHYSNGEFEAFFGAAQWVRMNAGADLTGGELDRLLALELLGLSRHCQWEAVTALKNEIRGPLALKAFELIEVKAEYKSFLSDPRRKSLSFVKKVTKSREHWGLEAPQMKSFGSPENLRVKVGSLCASS